MHDRDVRAPAAHARHGELRVVRRAPRQDGLSYAERLAPGDRLVDELCHPDSVAAPEQAPELEVLAGPSCRRGAGTAAAERPGGRDAAQRGEASQQNLTPAGPAGSVRALV